MDEPALRLQPHEFAGPEGNLDGRLELPDPVAFPQPRFLALFGHPHPQLGGTMQNLAVVHGARALARLGGAVARFDFRGVGKSAGSFGAERGELDDYLAVAAQVRALWPGVASLIAAGFSFGAMRAIECASRGAAEFCLAVAPPIGLVGRVPPPARVACPAALVLATHDEIVPAPSDHQLAERFADLRFVERIEGASHLFTGRIAELAAAVGRAATALLPP